MKKLLHIIATPRGEESRTLKVSGVFLEGIRRRYPDSALDTLNLFEEKIPELTLKEVSGKYALLGGNNLTGELKKAWQDIERHIARFLSADAYLISTPMWNFSIPYVLKHYIDVILQPRYLFRYTEKGPEGLAKNRKMAVITSRGGDYGKKSALNSYDYQEPYLRTVFGLAGIEDITFINAQPMDALGAGIREERIKEAKDDAEEAASRF